MVMHLRDSMHVAGMIRVEIGIMRVFDVPFPRIIHQDISCLH